MHEVLIAALTAVPLLLQACDGQLSQVKLSWKPQAALTVVMAAKGYPGTYKKGTPINSIGAATTAKVFHAGTSTDAAGQLVANGGRVLGVTALGADVAAAQAAAYEAVGKIDWEDAYYRKDIGWRAVARLKEGAAAGKSS
jgi:phosphoribosylamine--glycine ligase